MNTPLLSPFRETRACVIRTKEPVWSLASLLWRSGAVALILVATASAEPLTRGRQVYDDQGCAACHSIGGSGNRRHPLDGVGSRLSDEQIRLWITAPAQVDPKVRKRAFDHLSGDDLAALIAFVRSLPGAPTPPRP